MSDSVYKLTDPSTGKSVDLPVREASVGPATIDVGNWTFASQSQRRSDRPRSPQPRANTETRL